MKPPFESLHHHHHHYLFQFPTFERKAFRLCCYSVSDSAEFGRSKQASQLLEESPSPKRNQFHPASDLKTLERTDRSNLLLHTIKTEEKKTSIENGSHLQTNEKMLSAPSGKGSEDIEAAVKKLSLVSTSSSMDDDQINPFSVLLSICGQSAPSVLQDIFSRGNILVGRSDSETLQFTLNGKNMLIKTHGLIISIIDFTLSTINTGDSILYLDLSSDPDLFKGPKGDKQSETYRRMKEVTEDCWEGSCPKTNVLWLIYLVDILLMKKSFERTTKHERDLRSLKKRLDKYDSAKEAVLDPFFTDLFIESDPKA
ncbi:Serine/threonine-protein kinase haspin-like [Glycine soja]|uniref:non-specific serine/threonine protein kinase n=1 Tax=Glycine soja TaxID=3848 RepID=A0A445LFV9_GLYSO|nr:Serine/threonine-protein kinase haspin-like [Glycine soja]